MRRVFFISFICVICECSSARASERPTPSPVPVENTQSEYSSVNASESAINAAASIKAAMASVTAAKTAPRVTKALLNPYEAAAFFQYQAAEHRRFGIPSYAKRQKKKKYGNSVVMQRSGRKRLYDHNILLRALFDGHLHSDAYGNLREQFSGGIFFDIGSAVLFGEGAETVRDLYDDEDIRSNLTIIASDINDPDGKMSMFVDRYRESDEQLPFPVVEIPRLMDKPEHFTRPLRLFLNNQNGIILRSANSGPDLYYNHKQVSRHLRCAIMAFPEHNVLYLFNKFILYKPAARRDFLLIGEIDETVGTNHKQPAWEEIDWEKRTFAEAVKLNTQHITFRE